MGPEDSLSRWIRQTLIPVQRHILYLQTLASSLKSSFTSCPILHVAYSVNSFFTFSTKIVYEFVILIISATFQALSLVFAPSMTGLAHGISASAGMFRDSCGGQDSDERDALYCLFGRHNIWWGTKIMVISLRDFLHPPLTSSLFVTNILPNTLFSNTLLSLCWSLNVSHSYYLFSRRGFSHNQWAMMQLAVARTVSGSLHCLRWRRGLAGEISWGSRLAAAAAAARSFATRGDTFHPLCSGNVVRYSARELQDERRQGH